MKITEVKVRKFESGKTRGFASVTFDKLLVVTGIAIIEGKKGLFISMPQTKGKDDEYYDIVFPLTKEARESITKKVLDAYKKAADNDADELPFD